MTHDLSLPLLHALLGAKSGAFCSGFSGLSKKKAMQKFANLFVFVEEFVLHVLYDGIDQTSLDQSFVMLLFHVRFHFNVKSSQR